jgi:hypothetical protein
MLNTVSLRHQRDELLKATDKYLLSDYPITDNDLILIKEYRQKLRDYMDSSEIVNYDPKTPIPDFPLFPLLV